MILGVLLSLVVVVITALGFLFRSWINVPRGPPQTLADQSVPHHLRLVDKEVINKHVKRLRFALPSPDHILGVPLGQFVELSAEKGQSRISITRFPISSPRTKGYVDFLFKLREEGEGKEEGEDAASYIASLRDDEVVQVTGPHGSLTYFGKGKVNLQSANDESEDREESFKWLAVIAADTGIDAVLPIIRRVLEEEHAFHCSLLYINQTEDDILMRSDLEDLVASHPDHFILRLHLDKAPEGWEHGEGKVTPDVIRDWLPQPFTATFLLLNMPSGPAREICLSAIEDTDFPKARFHVLAE
uniref:NADH-cytochrome b5 reductase 1-like isoform X2 n=1 Tax=Myxine glutinosa TaxID=7769 RepID=UPI00358F0934